MRAGYDAIVQGLLIGKAEAHIGGLYGVYIAYKVGYRYIGCGQLLAIAAAAVQPFYRCVVAFFGQQLTGIQGYGREGVIVDLAAGNYGYPLIEQVHHFARHAGLGLPAQPQEEYVVAG